jgi:hypothetical protein
MEGAAGWTMCHRTAQAVAEIRNRLSPCLRDRQRGQGRDRMWINYYNAHRPHAMLWGNAPDKAYWQKGIDCIWWRKLTRTELNADQNCPLTGTSSVHILAQTGSFRRWSSNQCLGTTPATRLIIRGKSSDHIGVSMSVNL